MAQRSPVKLDRLVDREALMGARARQHEVSDRPAANSLAIGGIRPGSPVGVLLDRAAEVLADQARQLGLRIIGDLFEPRPDRGVRAGPMGLRHRPVRRVAQEGVLESQLDLAGQARRRAREDQAAIGEAADCLVDVGHAQGLSNRALPEDASHDRRLVEDTTLRERQCLDPGHEHPLDRVRDRGDAACGPIVAMELERPLFDQVADRLLQEERVPLRPGDDGRAQLVRERTGRNQSVDQAGGSLGAERRNLDCRQSLGRHEAGLPPQECRAGCRNEQEWAIEHRRDRGQRPGHRGSCPVEVLDDQDRAAALRVRAQESRPGLGDRRRDDARFDALERIAGDDDPRGRRQGMQRLVGLGRGETERREDPGKPVAEAVFCVVRPVVEPDPAGPSEDLAERPVADPSPRRGAATLEDRGCGRVRPGHGQEFANEAALADPGRAIDEHVPRMPCANGVVEGAEQHPQLGRTPDERRLEGRVAHSRFPRRRPWVDAHGEAESIVQGESVRLPLEPTRA